MQVEEAYIVFGAAVYMAGHTPQELAACAVHFGSEYVTLRMFFTGGGEQDTDLVTRVTEFLNEEYLGARDVFFEAHVYRGLAGMVPGDHLCFLRWDAWPFTCFHAVGAWPREASGATAPEWRLVEYAGQFTDPLTRETVRTHRALAIASGDRTLLIPANPIDKTIEGGVPLGASVWALLGAVTPRMLGIAVYGDSGEIGIVAVLEGSAEAEDVLAVSCMRWTILSDYVGVDVKISIVENVRPCDTGSHEPYGGMWVYGDSRSW